MKFINPRYEKIYNRIKEDFIRTGFTEEELSHPYLDKLSKQTKSTRIMRMIRLAYYLGWLRGIRYCDEMLNTKIELR